jgi:hypothetical protein
MPGARVFLRSIRYAEDMDLDAVEGERISQIQSGARAQYGVA